MKTDFPYLKAIAVLIILACAVIIPWAFLMGPRTGYETVTHSCPPPSNWSECVDFRHTRTSYYFNLSGNNHNFSEMGCYPKTETKSCVPPDESDEYALMDFEWKFNGTRYTWDFVIKKPLYDYYRNKPRPPTWDYSVYATDSSDDAIISELVKVFNKTSVEYGFDEYDVFNNIVAFVQAMPYTSDNVTTPFDEYPRYPLETLVENGGDCEDTAILTAVLINELGYEAVLLEFYDHVAVGVGCYDAESPFLDDYGTVYCYLETTGEGWRLGEIPIEYWYSDAVFRYLVKRPVVSINWSLREVTRLKVVNASRDDYSISVIIRNDGSGPAENVTFWRALESEEGEIYSHFNHTISVIEAGEERGVLTSLGAPKGAYTRVHIIVSGDNFWGQEIISDRVTPLYQ